LAALVFFGAIAAWIYCSAGPDPRAWPWWVYPVALFVAWRGAVHAGLFVRSVYTVFRWLPLAIKAGRLSRTLPKLMRRKFERESREHYEAMVSKIAEENLSPEEYARLRIEGLI
jgi:hypothetical protein